MLQAYLLSGTSSNSSTAFYRYFDYPKGRITQYAHDKSHGFSVRSIVDNLEESLIIPDNFHSIQILQNSESISENKNTGEILHNGSLYDGYLYNLYPSGQLKERFQIKKGVIIGDYSLYYEDFNFSIERFRDTNRIEELNASIIHEGDKLKQLSIDSSNSSNDQQEFFKKNIGSAKNHEALKTKNQENKLKGKKKEVFDNYSNLVSKYLNYLNEINNSQKIIAQFTKNRDLESEKIVYIPRPKMAFEKENDRKNGKYKSYYFNGRMKESGQYVNNIKEGEWSTYYENGKLESKGVFNKADMKIGDWQYFGLNGLISSKEKFENDGNIYSKINYSYFENGNLRDEIQVKISGVKGVKEGQYVEYHSNGKKKAEGKYNNNLQNGLWSYYFDNGLLQAKGNYINGNGGDQSDSGIPKNNRDGLWKIYTSDGKLLQDQSWTGIQQSLKSYYPSGNLQVKREYSNYPKNNYVETKYFDENGNVESESTYLNGKLNGISREYYSNGKIMAEGNSVNGKSHGKLKSYFDNGQLQMSFTADSTSLAAGNALGEIFQYDKSGKLINHVYANKDGSLLNKLAAASGSNSNSGTGVLSQARFNKSFNCECCGRTITGIKYAWGKDCGKASDDLLDPALYNYFSKSALTFESWYLYCGVNCVKTCSDTSPATGSPCN